MPRPGAQKVSSLLDITPGDRGSRWYAVCPGMFSVAGEG
jgi:hypothetical protein